MTADNDTVPTSTLWGRVWLLFAAGSSLAFHVGKIPAALPSLALEFELGLFSSSWIVSLFSVLIATFGLVAGVLTTRVDARLAAVSGLFVAGFSSLLGSFTDSVSLLIVCRSLEGAGWLVGAITVPVLMRRVAMPKDRALVLGIWGAFMPVGISLSLLISPWLMNHFQWRGLWLGMGLLTLIASVAVYLGSAGVRVRAETDASVTRVTLRDAIAIGLGRAPLFMAACFLVYSAQFLALTTFLPTLLVTEYGLSLASAAALGAVVVGSNAVGNVLAGWFLSCGMSYRVVLGVAFIMMGVAASLTYSDSLSLMTRWISAIAFSACGGLIPGTLFARAPHVVANPQHMVIINGLMLQAAGIGQLSGPPVVGYLVDVSGRWDSALAPTWILLVVAMWCVSSLRRSSSIEDQ